MQVQNDSQQDDEMAALLNHMMTSPPGGAAAAPAPAEAGSQEAMRSPGVHDEWAAYAADHELFSQHEVDTLREQFLQDMLEDQRCVLVLDHAAHRLCADAAIAG
jgi:hypothetical protein